MVRVGGRSKGCRVCRQRRIKCDEATPACVQCTSTGRDCPGPITGLIITDMTVKVSRANPSISGSESRYGNDRHRIPHSQSSVSHDVAKFINPSHDELVRNHKPSGDQKVDDFIRARLTQLTWLLDTPGNDFAFIERLGLEIDPFQCLPVKMQFSIPKLISHYIHVRADSVIALSARDPERSVWLPMIFSDQLLLHCTLYTSSVHMSVIYGIDAMSNSDVATYRGETLSLLSKRLAKPRMAINDSTLAAVLGVLGHAIVRMDVEETTLHLDGLDRILALNPSFRPCDEVRAMLFWRDLTGSALCHTHPRQYTTRPDIRMPCNPFCLNPRSAIGILCRGFQNVVVKVDIFNSIVDILHELRCLSIVTHYSGCKAHSEIQIFNDLCLSVKAALEGIPATEGAIAFESFRLAAMIYIDLVLLHDNSNAPVSAAGIKAAIGGEKIEQIMLQVPELLIWILFMGNVAAFETDMKPWFLNAFSEALSIHKVQHFEPLRRVLIEFLWIEGVLTDHLVGVWAAVQSRTGLEFHDT